MEQPEQATPEEVLAGMRGQGAPEAAALTELGPRAPEEAAAGAVEHLMGLLEEVAA